MKALPYFRWYPADAETDANFRAMDDADIGFYVRCLNHAWINGGIPIDPAERARVLKTRRDIADRRWIRVGKCFGPSASDVTMVTNSRQEKERLLALQKAQVGAESANRRWVANAADGGRPNASAQARAASASASDSLSENGFINSTLEQKPSTRACDDGKPQSNPPLAAPQPEQAEPDRPDNPQSIVHTNGNGNGKVLALVPQPNPPPDLFRVFWGLFVAAGKSLNVGEEMSCATMWALYGEQEQRQIIAFVVEQMKTKWRNEQYTPMPSNALRRQGWTAVGSPRRIPDVQEEAPNGAAAIARRLREMRRT